MNDLIAVANKVRSAYPSVDRLTLIILGTSTKECEAIRNTMPSNIGSRYHANNIDIRYVLTNGRLSTSFLRSIRGLDVIQVIAKERHSFAVIDEICKRLVLAASVLNVAAIDLLIYK